MRMRCALVLAVLITSVGITPAGATFPGENGKIVFVGNQSGTWQLYTINPDGSDVDQITNLPPTAWETWYPSFSPDGKQILFGRDTPTHPCGTSNVPVSGCVDLYVVDADGSELTQLTHDGLSYNGRWSPDGTSIVFSHVNPNTGEGAIATIVIHDEGKHKALTSEFWSSYIGTFTPDGRQIVFESQLDGLVSAAWSMNTDGSRQRRLTSAPLEAIPYDVSPDGSHILLSSHFNTLINSAIFTIDLDGQHLSQLTRVADAVEEMGSYSPDGKHIVFISNRLNLFLNYDLFTMKADGANVTRIASGLTVGGCRDENCVGPSWGPKPKH